MEQWAIDSLKQWFSGLMEGLQEVDEETRKKILAKCGQACAQAHSVEIFKKAWENSNDIDNFLENLNQQFGEVKYERKNDDTLSVTYPRCFCPLVNLGFVNSPSLCDCSPSWLKENFETVLDKPVTVISEETVSRGGKACRFTVTI